MPGIRLNPAAIAQYHREGYVCPVRVMGEEQAADFRARVEAFAAANATGLPTQVLFKSKAHLVCTTLLDLARWPAILDAVQDVLGPDLLLWAVGVFPKPPHDPAYISWHQDANYWGLEPPDIATAWVALTDSRADNGAMQVAPRTHTAPLLPHRDTWAPHNLLSRGQEIEVAIPPEQRVTLELAPGEMSLHHVNLAHGSEPNTSDRPRLGVAIRYVAAHVQQVKGGNASAILVRGQDPHGHFSPDPLPTQDFDPAAIARLQAAQAGAMKTPGG